MFAVAALAACTTEQTIVAPQNEAIGFDTFVDNSTRATDITTANIADFGVYGTVTKGDNSALISGICIDKSARNKGHGSLLLQELIDNLSSSGIYALVDINGPINFYTKNGFSIVSEFSTYKVK